MLIISVHLYSFFILLYSTFIFSLDVLLSVGSILYSYYCALFFMISVMGFTSPLSVGFSIKFGMLSPVCLFCTGLLLWYSELGYHHFLVHLLSTSIWRPTRIYFMIFLVSLCCNMAIQI